jgi:hypothetical protein
MLHWTLIPEELIFSEHMNTLPPTHETLVDGVLLSVQQDGDVFRIVRLLSPDPAHFLDPRFQPGNVIFSQISAHPFQINPLNYQKNSLDS